MRSSDMNADDTGGNGAPVGAVVVAAGESRRMQGVDKIFHPLGGVPLVWRCIATLRAHPLVADIVLVTSRANFEHAAKLIAANDAGGSVRVCEGGRQRQDSVRKGLDMLNDCEYVIVQDGARPFVSADMLDRGITAAMQGGAAIAAVPVKDTIKITADAGNIADDANKIAADAGKTADDAGKIAADARWAVETLPRDRLWAAQTPQIFETSLLKAAHRQVSEPVTDDASMVEMMGRTVRLFLGSYFNIKVTTPEDLIIADAIVRSMPAADAPTADAASGDMADADGMDADAMGADTAADNADANAE